MQPLFHSTLKPRPIRVGIKNVADYSPFGVPLNGRTFSTTEYRIGFQNQEKDDEIKGEGNSVNYTYRMHDPRMGRFFAVDPLAPKYPWNSVYAFSENVLINAIELEGREQYFTYKGEFVGAIGDDPVIKVLNSSRTLEDARKNYHWAVSSDPNMVNHLAALNDNSSVFDGTTHSIAFKNVLLHYYNEIGGDPEGGSHLNIEKSFSANYSRSVGGTANGPKHGVGFNQFKIDIGNKYIGDGDLSDAEISMGENEEIIINMFDLQNLLVHERDHGRLGYEYLKKNPDWNYDDVYQNNGYKIYHEFESSATWAQLKHKTWEKTSLEYKQSLWDNGYGSNYVTDEKDIQKYFKKYGVVTSEPSK